VLTEIRNRGVADVCIVVCDGLKGLPDAVTTVWPLCTVQTCIIHLIRNSFPYASRRDWEALARDLRPVYTAATEPAAAARFDELAEKWGSKYPAIITLVAQRLDRVRAVPGLRHRDPSGHLLHQCHRVAQRPQMTLLSCAADDMPRRRRP
jgi:putative transposase